jgi:hypothetical protein
MKGPAQLSAAVTYEGDMGAGLSLPCLEIRYNLYALRQAEHSSIYVKVSNRALLER